MPSRSAASILALLTAASVWLSAGTLAVSGGDTPRIAALPSIWILVMLAAAAVLAARTTRLRLAEAWPLAISLLLWLPFLPGHIPPAFLLWQGPIEAIVWLIVAAALLAARPFDSLRSLRAGHLIVRTVRDPRRAPWIAGALVALSGFAAFTQVPDVIPGGDEPHYLAATQSLLQDFDLRVANNYAQGDYLAYFPGRLEPHFLKRATSGEIYSIHAPGVSLVMLPAFAIAGYAGGVLTMIVIAGLTAALTWRMAWQVSGSVAGAWLGVGAVCGTAPYFFHVFAIYPEIIGGFCVMCGVWSLLELDDGRSLGTRSLIAVGAALALLPWLHSRFAVLAGLLGAMLVARLALRLRSGQATRERAFSSIAAFLAVPTIAGVAWLTYFWLIWGSPSPIAPYGANTETSASYVLRGLIGLLIDQQFGLITTAPVYVMVVVGAVAFARQRSRVAIELLVLALTYAVTVASYAMWWAGAAAPARFLVAILPLAALAIAMLCSGNPKEGGASPSLRWPVCLTILLLLISGALVVPRALVENGRLIFNNRGAFDATLEWLSQIVDLSRALPSVHRSGGSAALLDAAVWLVALAIAAALTAATARRRSPAITMTIGSLALAIAVMTSASAVWGYRGGAIVTAERSKLAALAAFRPAWQTTLADPSSWRRLSGQDFLAAMAIDLPAPAARINRVPAGEYELRVTSTPSEPAPLLMFVGRNDPPIEMPQLADLREGRLSFRLRLPVSLLSLNMVTKGAVGPAWFTLQPAAAVTPASDRYATRAARYGRARAFFFDEQAYLESDGFWTRGEGSALVVLDRDDGGSSGLPIAITAGAVATTVDLAVGDWEQSLSLAAGQRQEVTLPPSDSGAWALSIRSGAGFRPSERDPANRDVRFLAAWIAVR